MERVIKVTSQGVKRVKPDTIIIEFTVKAEDKNYVNMHKLAEEQFVAIQNAIEHAGFEKKQLRTQKYRLERMYREIRTENEEYENVFSGYECNQFLMLKFPMDIQKLHAVLKSIDSCESKPIFHIDFTLSNSQKARNEALRDAAINARHEAELVAEALGAHLGDLHKIDIFSDSNYFPGMSSHHSTGFASSPLLAIDEEIGTMQPDNITICASAEFIWEIKG